MAFLVHPVPPIPVYVRKEYLYDLEKGHGEFTPGIWISVKSTMYKALYFETLLTDYGALYDKLPISAFVWKTDHGELLPLDVLQLWDCFDYDITVIQKPLLSRCEFFGKDRRMHAGEYEFTIDNCHRDNSVLNTNFSEHDPEHKSFNVIRLDNGQFAAQPNNRVIWRDSSLTPDNLLQPDFKVCTQNYAVETEPKWSVGHTDEWQYKTKDEESLEPIVKDDYVSMKMDIAEISEEEYKTELEDYKQKTKSREIHKNFKKRKVKRFNNKEIRE